MIITTAKTAQDLQGILDLQQLNLAKSISKKEFNEQGFVTVEHDFETLRRMNSPHPHIIAKSGEKVVGYALTMLKEARAFVPVLDPMFGQIDELSFEGKLLKHSKYLTMGQICIAKEFRGQGVFYQLYDFYKKQFAGVFDYVVTEVSERNKRSLRAHAKAGFEVLHRFSDKTDDWVLIILKIPSGQVS